MKRNLKIALLTLSLCSSGLIAMREMICIHNYRETNTQTQPPKTLREFVREAVYRHQLSIVVRFWKLYFATNNSWEKLVEGVTPFQSGCGSVYVLPGLPERPTESIAIADMRAMPITHPHYHNIETEIYFVLQGTGTVVVAGKEIKVKPGSIVVTQPGNAHFTVPSENHDLVMAVVNNPPFDINNFINLEETNTEVGFDQEQYTALQSCCSK